MYKKKRKEKNNTKYSIDAPTLISELEKKNLDKIKNLR